MQTESSESLTYDQLAERLGIGRQSARQLAMRKRWPRKPGNDGLARVAVPADALTRPEARNGTRTEARPEARNRTRHATRTEAGSDTRPEAASEAVDEAPALRVTVARLEEQVVALKDRVAEGEKRADELRAERDRWAAEVADLARRFAQLAQDAGARESALRDELAARRATVPSVAQEPHRPWWRRLTG